MKTVQQHPKAWVIDFAHQLPDLLPGVDVPPPGQGFITNAQATAAGVFGQQAEVITQDRMLTRRVRRGIAAHQHQISAQFLHQVELALGALQVARQAIAAASFKVTKRLEQRDGNAQVGTHLPHLTGAAVVIQQVVLEDFHPIKPGRSNGFELFRQGAAQGNSGDGTLHGVTPGNEGWSCLRQIIGRAR